LCNADTGLSTLMFLPAFSPVPLNHCYLALMGASLHWRLCP